MGLSVTNNISKSITVIDMPYKTYENKLQALKNARNLLNFTKAKMIKLEIKRGNLTIIKYLSSKNLNVVAHIGVTPQSFVDLKKIKACRQNKKRKSKFIKIGIRCRKSRC